MNEIDKKEISEIIEQNYYVLASTGVEAMSAIFDDYLEGRFEENLHDWGIGYEELLAIIYGLHSKWMSEGKMQTQAIEWVNR